MSLSFPYLLLIFCILLIFAYLFIFNLEFCRIKDERWVSLSFSKLECRRQ